MMEMELVSEQFSTNHWHGTAEKISKQAMFLLKKNAPVPFSNILICDMFFTYICFICVTSNSYDEKSHTTTESDIQTQKLVYLL
jgi:hypothetical protein